MINEFMDYRSIELFCNSIEDVVDFYKPENYNEENPYNFSNDNEYINSIYLGLNILIYEYTDQKKFNESLNILIENILGKKDHPIGKLAINKLIKKLKVNIRLHENDYNIKIPLNILVYYTTGKAYDIIREHSRGVIL